MTGSHAGSARDADIGKSYPGQKRDSHQKRDQQWHGKREFGQALAAPIGSGKQAMALSTSTVGSHVPPSLDSYLIGISVLAVILAL
jgi:hypothetical protein